MKSIEEILKQIRPEFDFTSSDNFYADGMLDSFDMVTLIAELDTRFSLSIDGMDILPENFQNIGAIERLLGKYGVKL